MSVAGTAAPQSAADSVPAIFIAQPPHSPHSPLPAGFNGNQTALWNATNSTGNSFLINVHGTAAVVVGDVTIPAFSPVESEWFCDGYSALLGKQ